MKKASFLLTATLLLHIFSFAQPAERTCGSMNVLERQLRDDPSMQLRMQQIEQFTNAFVAKQKSSSQKTSGVSVTIPVVVHVVYRTSAENISDAQVLSQIDALNRDYAAMNADTSGVPAMFKSLVANTGIQFCLAQRDANGNPATGIVRKQTTRTSFSDDDAVKKSSTGGDDAWDRNKYLNIWVCNLGGGLLGYAQFPGGPAATDGVVILYTAFGNTGAAAAPYNLGRTATHEVGHWLNLRHIWGDALCGNDLVNDTPTQQTSNYGCPSFPHKTCSNNGDMSMNYMDYTDDKCMFMFSAGQSTRMNALFATGGARVSLLSSNGCEPLDPNQCYAPANLSATSVMSSSATLNWSVFGSPAGFTIQYKPTGASAWTTVTSSVNSIALSDLSANTTYHFQVQTVCANGTSAFSTPATFTTSPEPGSCVANLYEPNNTMASLAPITVGTDIRAMIENGSDIDWFSFTNTSAEPNIQVSLTNLPKDYSLGLYKSGVLLASSSNAGTADELITYATTKVGMYWIRVSGNASNNSKTLCYTLKATIYGSQQACGVASSLAATNIDQVSATLVWTAVSGATSYNVQYRVFGTSIWITTVATSTSKNISGLTADTKYEFQVQAVCASGAAAYSPAATFTTAGVASDCSPNAFEPNNTMGQLAPITVGTEINAMIEAGSDVDWFSFANTSAQPNIQVRLSNLPKDYTLGLYKSGRLLVTSANAGIADEAISYNTRTVGTYWIRVWGNAANNSKTLCYTLKASLSAVALQEDAPSSPARFEQKAAVRLYPNPGDGNMVLQYTAPAGAQVVAKVFDLSGNELYQYSLDASESLNTYDLDLRALSSGMYLLELFDGQERTIQKIFITK
jgi:hypothetical protein